MLNILRIGAICALSVFSSAVTMQSGGDSTFVLKASESDMTEIHLGKLASKQGDSPAVREFAARMVKDHTKSSAELTTVAAKQGFSLAKEISSEHKQACDKLSKMAGAEFDRNYITGQVKAHREAVKLFKNQVKSGQDADLRAFANKTLPVIEEHLKMAQDIAKTFDDKK